MFTISRHKLLSGLVSLAALMVPLSSSRAQSVPIPFAGLYAGGGTVCSASLPVYTVSGTGGAKYGDGCPATQAVINVPVAVASDAFGNVFIADQTDDLIRVVYNGGTALANAIVAANVQQTGLVPQKGYIYTIVGGVTASPTSAATYYCNQSGTGTVAQDRQLNGCPGTQTYVQPRGLFVDADGNLFFANVGAASSLNVLYVAGTRAASLITLETPNITTPQVGYTYNLAGTATSSYTGDGALAYKATINTPRGIFVDPNENVYFADNFNLAVRRIDSTTGFISTVAGHNAGSVTACTATNVVSAGDGASATAATTTIACPYGEWLDQYGNIFIAEAGNGGTVPGRIRVVYEGGTLPGIPAPAVVGNIYTFAGGPPVTGGTATTAAQQTTFQEVFGVTIDPVGYLYVTDYRTGSSGSNKIWRVDPNTGSIATIVGNSGTAVLTVGAHCNGGATGPVTSDKYGDGCPGPQAYLQNPQESLAFTANGTFYVADRVDNIIRSFTYNNNFPATPVGSSITQPIAFLYPASLPVTETFTTQGASATDFADAGTITNPDTCALNTTLAVATTCVDYVKFTPTLVGQREAAVTVATSSATIATQTLNGIGSSPSLTITPPTAVPLGTAIQPAAISTDDIGNVNISDNKGKQLLRTTIAGGTPTALLTGLGTPAQSTTDPYGNVFVADSTNNKIVEHTTANTTATFGTGLSAPQGLAADLYGNLYVADTGNNRLLYISPLTGNQRVVPTSGFTLSAPTSLALDSTGNLYIIDTNNSRLIEIPLSAQPLQIPLPTGSAPTSLAVDPAGDLYLADKSSGSILFVAAGTTTATQLLTGFTTPAGVAVGPTGNVFVADSSATSAAGYNFAVNNTTFPTTNIQLTSLPTTLTLANVGNLAATLSSPAFTETGTATAFPPSGTATCTAALALNPSATCTQAFVFAPTTPGPQSAKVVFSDTAAQTVTANFNGTATNLILTTTTISPLNATAPYGQNNTYTVTITPRSTGASTPTGTVTFFVDGVSKGTQSVTTTPYTYTFTTAPGVGVHSVAATYSGDPVYAGSNASTFLTVTKAVTTTTVSYLQTAAGTQLTAIVTPATVGALSFTGNVLFYVDSILVATVPVGNGTVVTTALVADGAHTYYAMYVGDANYLPSTSATQNLTVARAATTTTLTSTPVSVNGVGGLQLTATVTSTTPGTPSGTVKFSNGTTTLATLTLPASGVVSYTTTTTTYTNYSFTAAYSGDGLYDPSSSTITQGADFVVNAPITPLVVPQGGQALEAVTVTSINGYTGSLTAACSNLPINAICTFLPVPVALSATAPATLSVEVFVGVNPNVAVNSTPNQAATSHAYLALLLLAPAALYLRRRRLSVLLAAVVLCVGSALFTGCGVKTPAYSPNKFSTPVGTTTVTVTLTDTNKVSRSTTFPVTVNSQ